MTDFQPYRRLRVYLIAFFVPLTGLPLVALAVLTYVFVSTALDREIRRRSVSELAAVARNIDTVERRLDKQLVELARRDGLKLALMVENPDDIQKEIKSWMNSAHLERVRVFSAQTGSLISEQRVRDAKRFEDSWSTFFGSPGELRRKNPRGRAKSRGPASEGDPEPLGADREPSAQQSSPPRTLSANPFLRSSVRFERGDSSRLSSEFRRFLRTEDSWSLREVRIHSETPDSKKSLVFVFYKMVVDADYKPTAFLEGQLSFDEARLDALADHQGIELAVLGRDLDLIAASDRGLAQHFAPKLREFRAVLQSGEALKDASTELVVNEQPVEFFFTPVTNDAGERLGWISAGLYKGEQVTLRNQITLWIVAMALGLAVLVVALTVRISNKITQPVTDLVRATEAMKMGEWVHPVEADSSTEIGYLVKRFNEMAQSVQVTKRTLELKLEELANAHNALTETQGQLVQSAKMSSLGQLVAGVAHELNNPIAFIYSNMTQMRLHLRALDRLEEIMREMRSRLGPKDLEQLDRALGEVEWDYLRQDMTDMVQSCLEGSIRVKDIVLGLRNFSRLDKGEISDVELNATLENTAKLLNSQIKNRVEIHWDLCSDSRVRCNVSQINQVFMNLLANALQAIEGRGEIWIRTWSEIPRTETTGSGSATDEIAGAAGGDDNPGFVCVSIRDSGTGIKPEVIDRIFDPFFTTKKVGEGTGLGLSIVYGIVERHRGSIRVRSTVAPTTGHGTEFIVRLPREGGASGAGDSDSPGENADTRKPAS